MLVFGIVRMKYLKWLRKDGIGIVRWREKEKENFWWMKRYGGR